MQHSRRRPLKKSPPRDRRTRCRRDVIVHVCPDHPDHAWISTFTCNDRFCPQCSRQRLRPRLQHLSKLAAAQIALHPSAKCRHIILTWKPHEVTKANVRALWKATRLFLDELRPLWSVRALEISPGRFLHVHIAAGIAPTSKRQLETLWRRIAGHSWIVRVTAPTRPHSIKGLMHYLLTYTTKALPLHDVPEIRSALLGTRRIATTGTLYGAHQEEAQPHGCPRCPMKTRAHLLRIPRRLSVDDVATLLEAFPDHERTLRTIATLHCRSPELLTNAAAALIGYHTNQSHTPVLADLSNRTMQHRRTPVKHKGTPVPKFSPSALTAYQPHQDSLSPACGGPEEVLPNPNAGPNRKSKSLAARAKQKSASLAARPLLTDLPPASSPGGPECPL